MVRLSTFVFLFLNIFLWVSCALETETEIGSENKNRIGKEGLHKEDSESIVDSCLRVSNAIKFNEDFLNNYKYDEEHCLKYKRIGNYVLEKNRLSYFNCYKQIQKPLCKLYYTERDDNKIEDYSGKECEGTKDFFISLLKRCTVKGHEDPLVHCASFSKSKKFIQDGSIFCNSSYERREEKEDENKKSVYGDNFTRNTIKTYTFTKDQFQDCINIVNNYNHCSVVERNLLKLNENQSEDEVDACLTQRSSHYCNVTIQKVENRKYPLDCSDIILPYLLSSKNENTRYTQLCYDIQTNYLSILKEQKNELLKEKRKLEEEIKNMRVLFKSSKIVENMFNFLKNEMESSNYDIYLFFEKIGKLRNKRVLQHEEYKINLQKLSDKINKFKSIISKFEYPSFEKNSREENISSIKKTKISIDNLIILQREIADLARTLNDFIEKKSSSTFNEESQIQSNYDEIVKLQNNYSKSKKLINEHAERNEDIHMEYFKSQEKDFKESITNYNRLIEILSQQITLVLERNFM